MVQFTSMPLRFYVGGINPSCNIKEKDIEECFNKLPHTKVSEVNLLRSKWTGELRGFAYVEVINSSCDSEHNYEKDNFLNYQKLYNGSKWKGCRLRIEESNPTYLQRIQREAVEKSESFLTPHCIMNDSKCNSALDNTCNNASKHLRESNLVYTSDNASDDESQINLDDSTLVKNDGRTFIEKEKIIIGQKVSLEANPDRNEMPVVDPTLAITPVCSTNNAKHESQPKGNNTKIHNANELRLQAIQRRNEFKKEVKVAAPCGTRTVFEDYDESDSNGKSSNPLAWMNDFDEDKDGSVEAAFQIREEFQGEKGKALFHLQQKFGDDNRFRLNEQFLDDVAEKAVEPVEAINYEVDLESEESRNFAALQFLYPDSKQPTKKQCTIRDISTKTVKDAGWRGATVRYDPASTEANETLIDEIVQEQRIVGVPKTQIVEQKKEFMTSSALNNAFSRVRRNSIDAMYGEPALDGILPSNVINLGSVGGFKASSLFSSFEQTQSPSTVGSVAPLVPSKVDEPVRPSKSTEFVPICIKKSLLALVSEGSKFRHTVVKCKKKWQVDRKNLSADYHQKRKQASKSDSKIRTSMTT